MRILAAALAGLLGAWLALEMLVRWVAARPCRLGFYGSLARADVRSRQQAVGVRANRGPGWVHLGWIADPARERYVVERWDRGGWERTGAARFGSFLTDRGGRFRVVAVTARERRLLGETEVEPQEGSPRLETPRIAGPWRTLFRPARAGRYVNDHCVYRDARGDWRLAGITDHGPGDPGREHRFAVGTSAHFPPRDPDGMREEAPIADFGALAWAPTVVRTAEEWLLFWSPHVLRAMRSNDGISWSDPQVVMGSTQHRFFRDAFVVEAAPEQWLLYATARGRYFSRIDLYQSFDLRHWQYVRAALRTGWGSERNAAFASTESPSVFRRQGRWYLALTYNNGSGFWNAVLLTLRIWPDRASYNDTLVFHSTNPYDFGLYRGRSRAPTLAAHVEAHAPEWVEHPETGQWWITTAGWPWAATLTSGEVAVAPLAWDPASPR